MKKGNVKKLAAFAMAAIMAFCPVTTTFAADATDAGDASGNIAGDGTLEYVDKNVFTVTLPTTSDVDFTLDPSELIKLTQPSATLDATAFSSVSDGYGADILFKDATNYITKSKDITVVNKSTFDVDVSVGVKVTGLTDATEEADGTYDIKLVDPTEENFTAGTDTWIAVAVTATPGTIKGTTETEGSAGTAKYVTDATNGLNVKEKVTAIADSTAAYEVTGTTGNYEYKIKSEVSGVTFNEVQFNLSGKVNQAADWSKYDKASTKALKVEVTYSVAKHVEGSLTPVFTTGDGVGEIKYEKGTSETDKLVTITAINCTLNGKAYNGLVASGTSWTAATVTDNLITLDSKFVAFWASAGTVEATITYEDASGATKTATVSIKTAAE